MAWLAYELGWIRPEDFPRKMKSHANRSSTIMTCPFGLDPAGFGPKFFVDLEKIGLALLV